MKDEDLIVLIYDQLYRLGLTANYAGFFQTSYSVLLACREPDKLQLATKWLYPEVADRYKTSWKAVERNIRYSITVLWTQHPNRLCELFGELLTNPPSAVKFIAKLAHEAKEFRER